MTVLNVGWLEREARRLTGERVVIAHQSPGPGRAGDVTYMGGAYVVRLSPYLCGDSRALGLAFLHELGHIKLRHVATPSNPAPAPGSVLARAAAVVQGDAPERQANAWAWARWQEYSESERARFAARATVKG